MEPVVQHMEELSVALGNGGCVLRVGSVATTAAHCGTGCVSGPCLHCKWKSHYNGIVVQTGCVSGPCSTL